MPKNTGAGFVIAALSAAFGFAMIWHMWPAAIVSLAAVLAAVIIHTFNYDRDYHLSADDVLRVEDRRTQVLASHV